MPVVLAPTGAPPTLTVVSVTAIEVPARAVHRADTAETDRSGPIAIVPNFVLFQFDVSTTASSASARASRKYHPDAIPVGIVTVTDPVSVAPGSSAPTARCPRTASPASTPMLVERK